jgi:hypothetical protein
MFGSTRRDHEVRTGDGPESVAGNYAVTTNRSGICHGSPGLIMPANIFSPNLLA